MTADSCMAGLQLLSAVSCGLTAALLRSVSTHQLRSGRRDRRRPAAPQPGPRAEGNICCDHTSQPPAASSLAMFSDFWEEDLYKVSSISSPAACLLTFMALLGISVDEMSGYLTASENSIKCFLRTVKLTVVVNNRREAGGLLQFYIALNNTCTFEL